MIRWAPRDGKGLTAVDSGEAANQRRRRALEEPLDVRPNTRLLTPAFDVRNPRHGSRYLVLLPELPRRESALCSCPDFGRRGFGTCKHVEAALLALDDSPELARWDLGDAAQGAGSLWSEIDRRVEVLLRSSRWDGRVLRSVGAVLFGG